MSSTTATTVAKGRFSVPLGAAHFFHLFVCIAAALVSVPAIAQQRHPECQVPWEWRLPPRNAASVEVPLGNYRWVRDRNENRIDDLLEDRARVGFPNDSTDPRIAAGETLDLVIVLNKCLAQDEMQRMINRWDVTSLSLYEARYLPVIVLSGVRIHPHLLDRIAGDSNVAMVEWGEPLIPVMTKGMQTIRWTPRNSAATTGKAIAIIDTGISAESLRSEDGEANRPPAPTPPQCVINDSVKESLNATRDSSTWYRGRHCVCRNAECLHGSRVWTVLAGYPSATMGMTGAAPAAPVLDIRACTSMECRPKNVFRALDEILRRHNEIAVVNMSIAGCAEDDGTSSYPQMIDRISASGVPVVTAMGNVKSCLVNPETVLVGRPASASLAVVVSGVDDRGDTIELFGNLHGPRCDGTRQRNTRPLATKPDVSAPASKIQLGSAIASGTSLAAPFVTGILATAAAELPQRPSICAIKCALWFSARAAVLGHVPGEWHPSVGYGLVDGTTFLRQLAQNKRCQLSDQCEERVRTSLNQPTPVPDRFLELGRPCE